MIVLEWIRFFAGTAFLIGGLVVFTVEFFGVFKFNYVFHSKNNNKYKYNYFYFFNHISTTHIFNLYKIKFLSYFISFNIFNFNQPYHIISYPINYLSP